jgi:hypothetical protein
MTRNGREAMELRSTGGEDPSGSPIELFEPIRAEVRLGG